MVIAAPHAGEIILVISVIVGLIERGGGQDQTDRARGEVVQFPPGHRREIQAEVGSVEVEALFAVAVLHGHVEATGDGDHELMQVLVGVPAAVGAAGYVVEVVNAPDLEGDVPAVFHVGEVAARIGDPGKVD
jgi:hypothetical protein